MPKISIRVVCVNGKHTWFPMPSLIRYELKLQKSQTPFLLKGNPRVGKGRGRGVESGGEEKGEHGIFFL